jgi:choline dehydrogenase-like flavoprotein
MSVIDEGAKEHLGARLHTFETWRAAGGGPVKQEADVVIVGAGPSGLVAGLVHAAAGARVLVLEDGSLWLKGSFKRKQSWALRHIYQDRGQRVMLGNVIVSLQSGRGVGGGTLVNSAISFRTPDYVLDEWVERQGLDYWRRGEREALYDEVEAVIGVSPTAVGVAGKNTLIAKRGFEALGVRMEHAFMPRSAPGCAGCGTCQTGCPSGGKASADLTWLPRMLRAGGELRSDVRVDELIVEQGGARVVGVRGVIRDPETGAVAGELEVRAPRVILAAGAVNTALILQRQDLANSSGMVGQNLHAHPGLGCLARMDEDVALWWGATQGYYARMPDEPEVLLETFSISPDILVAQAGGVGHETMAFMRDIKRLAACGLLIRDHSVGSVQWKRDAPPSFSYTLLESDRMKMMRGLMMIGKMLFAAGAKAVMPALAGASFMPSMNSLADVLNKTTDPMMMRLYASHPMGTCRIGDDPSKDVVRPQDGRTHDVEGLYIVDSSLMPTALGVNPQMTIMAQSLALSRRMVAAG